MHDRKETFRCAHVYHHQVEFFLQDLLNLIGSKSLVAGGDHFGKDLPRHLHGVGIEQVWHFLQNLVGHEHFPDVGSLARRLDTRHERHLSSHGTVSDAAAGSMRTLDFYSNIRKTVFVPHEQNFPSAGS